MIWVRKKIGHRTESGVAGRYSGMILIWFSWASWDILRSIVFVVEKAEDFNNAGNDAYRKKDFAKAIFFYTEGIKVECKDKELVSKLYNNRSTVYFYRGKSLKINNTLVDPCSLILFTLILLSKAFWKKIPGCLFLFDHRKGHIQAIFWCVNCFSHLFLKRKWRNLTNSGFPKQEVFN